MENAKKGQVNEIAAGTLDGGIRFYKLPRLIFDALGVKPTFAEIILGFAKFADGVKMAKARESLQPDDQRLRLIRAGKLSDENIADLFDVLLTSKRMKPVDWQSLAQEENVTDAPSLMLQVLNGIEHQQSDTQSEPWFTLVLAYFRESLLVDRQAIKQVKDASSVEEKASRLSQGFVDSFGISLDVRALTAEQEFLLRAEVLKRFAVLTELIMAGNLADLRQFTPTYEDTLPNIGKDEKLVVSSNLLIRKMLERWRKTKNSSEKKEDFYRFLTLHLESKSAVNSYKDKTIDTGTLKKKILRWESGKYRLKSDEFWKMFDWAFPELQSAYDKDSRQPLQIFLLVLTVNLFTRLQRAALDIGIAPVSIFQGFSDYSKLSCEGKAKFENWLSEQKAL